MPAERVPFEPDLIEQLEETTHYTPPTPEQKAATALRAAELARYFGSVSSAYDRRPLIEPDTDEYTASSSGSETEV